MSGLAARGNLATWLRMASARDPLAILWFRQDLRLDDHAALTGALRSAQAVLPVYVLPEKPHGWLLGGASRWWLHHSLTALAEALEARGATLILRRGDPARILAELAETTQAGSVHCGFCAEPAWRAMDERLEEDLRKTGRRLVQHRTGRLFDPEAIRTKTGGIYGIYSPFANAARALGDPPKPEPAPRAIPCPARRPPSDALTEWHLLPVKPDWAGGLREDWTPGEAAAQTRARHFLKSAAATYDHGRNVPGEDLTSRLSPHLHWGEISPVRLWHELRKKDYGEGGRVFANELIWRDFAGYLLWHKPQLPDAPLRQDFTRLPWRQDRPALRAWQRGRTGVPIVDAGMRQLWTTGWMHNRVRMITASFLVKHLLTDWRAGADWFLDTLVDADLASNSTNWQWVAGTGIDSQPFFRVFNPLTQGQKFDAAGRYVRAWVPELAALPDRYLHAPWTAPADIMRSSGVTLGRTYPTPVVDLATARQRALTVYRETVRAGAADAAA